MRYGKQDTSEKAHGSQKNAPTMGRLYDQIRTNLLCASRWDGIGDVCACVCVCACEHNRYDPYERERERDRCVDRGKIERDPQASPSNFPNLCDCHRECVMRVSCENGQNLGRH